MKTGIYVPLITPFNKDGSVDYEGLAKATKFTLSTGADGIYACGGSAEFNLLTTEERKKCLEVIIANADGKEIIAHVGSQSTAEAIELAKHAEKAGATMLSAVAPYYFGYSFAQVNDYFHKIAHATSLNLMIYNATQSRSYSYAEMVEILKDEKITAVKYTGYNFFFLERLIKEYPDKVFYTGADEMYIAGQAVGAHGAIGTSYNFFAKEYIECGKLFAEGKNKEALDIIKKVNGVTEIFFETSSGLAAAKYIMTLQGLDILPISREPFSPLTEDFKKHIREVFETATK